jgi:hypothetical protein
VLIDARQLPNVFIFRTPLSENLAAAKLEIGRVLKAKWIW